MPSQRPTCSDSPALPLFRTIQSRPGPAASFSSCETWSEKVSGIAGSQPGAVMQEEPHRGPGDAVAGRPVLLDVPRGGSHVGSRSVNVMAGNAGQTPQTGNRDPGRSDELAPCGEKFINVADGAPCDDHYTQRERKDILGMVHDYPRKHHRCRAQPSATSSSTSSARFAPATTTAFPAEQKCDRPSNHVHGSHQGSSRGVAPQFALVPVVHQRPKVESREGHRKESGDNKRKEDAF